MSVRYFVVDQGDFNVLIDKDLFVAEVDLFYGVAEQLDDISRTLPELNCGSEAGVAFWQEEGVG